MQIKKAELARLRMIEVAAVHLARTTRNLDKAIAEFPFGIELQTRLRKRVEKAFVRLLEAIE